MSEAAAGEGSEGGVRTIILHQPGLQCFNFCLQALHAALVVFIHHRPVLHHLGAGRKLESGQCFAKGVAAGADGGNNICL